MKQIFQCIFLTIAITLLWSCTSTQIIQQPLSQSSQDNNTAIAVNSPSAQETEIILTENLEIATGQTIYVPIYSHVYYANQQRIYNLSATLSIRNTDLTNSIIITAVKYYDTDGKLVKQYVQNPLKLGPLVSRDFYLEQKDTTGGSGANFLVEWVAEKQVNEPIVEAVMVGVSGSQAVAFSSSGKVIQNKIK
ncbi:hypothetical protein AFK68_26825 [Hydrocoleum sp. CS-953]|uniref:DUF3124 domain-containing protein n=1 Tax=Hydrocoleum sp. CS-953 TaxID=1671698 RepID=UPI000B9AC4EF|nr:DUF3124 domain-containing protein [Hydrocoleum sp. CS-953]OZH52054.1 hypothetical protein AFK68_26825 [Hydrocoleum sp. CS-953]